MEACPIFLSICYKQILSNAKINYFGVLIKYCYVTTLTSRDLIPAHYCLLKVKFSHDSIVLWEKIKPKTLASRETTYELIAFLLLWYADQFAFFSVLTVNLGENKA